jgi:hypothetical protein
MAYPNRSPPRITWGSQYHSAPSAREPPVSSPRTKRVVTAYEAAQVWKGGAPLVHHPLPRLFGEGLDHELVVPLAVGTLFELARVGDEAARQVVEDVVTVEDVALVDADNEERVVAMMGPWAFCASRRECVNL